MWQDVYGRGEAVPPSWQGPMVASINAGHIYRRDATGEAFIPWRAVGVIVDTEKHFFVIFKGGSSGFIIPRRAFTSVDDSQAFYDTAKSYWVEAQLDAEI